MPIRISDLRKETRSVSFEWEGETVNLKYRPGAVTAQMQMSAAGIATLGDNAGLVVEYLGNYIESMASLIAEWDVLGEDGTPIPISVETMELLTLPFIFAMFGAIMGAYNPNGKSAKS